MLKSHIHLCPIAHGYSLIVQSWIINDCFIREYQLITFFNKLELLTKTAKIRITLLKVPGDA